MIPRITSFEPMADYKLLVNFDGGRNNWGDTLKRVIISLVNLLLL